MATTAKPLYEVGNTISSEHNTDVTLNVMVANKHFRVDLFTTNFEPNPKLLQEYLLHVQRSDPTCMPPPPPDSDSDSDDYLEDPLEEFYAWAMSPFTPLFQALPPLDRTRTYTLQDCLFPERFVYTLQVNEDEKLVPVKRDTDPANILVGALLPASKPGALDSFGHKIYRPSEVRVRLADDAAALPTYFDKVYVDEDDCAFFKAILPGDVGMTVTELDTYAKIAAAGFGDDVRVSRLRGVVQDQDTERVVGLLLSYIDSRNARLSCAARLGGDVALHEKWLGQIRHSVSELHSRGIVWGDVKPDNVLIDGHGDAYLVDFGGGYTTGWVDRELENTMDGDLQGVRRVEAYLAGLVDSNVRVGQLFYKASPYFRGKEREQLQYICLVSDVVGCLRVVEMAINICVFACRKLEKKQSENLSRLASIVVRVVCL